MASSSIVSSVVFPILPLSQSLHFGSAGDPPIVRTTSIVYAPSYCLVHLLSEVASLYAIVRTSYCLVVAIVSDLPFVITYAYY